MSKKILVTDGLSADAQAILVDKYKIDLKKGLSADELKEVIGGYEAIIIRSATKLTRDVLEAADRLEVIGRVGVGVDNVDLTAATKKGILVVNAPGSNSVSVAEHTIGLMMSLARKIPEANISTQSGKWEKSRFKGMEIEGKTLGVIGFGKIGFLVAKKALGLGISLRPFLPFQYPAV